MKRERNAFGWALLFGLVLIWALFLPRLGAGAHRFFVDWRPPVALLALLLLLGFAALAGRRLAAPLRWLFALLILVFALLQFVAVTVETVLDRPLDLYFDIGHVSDLLGLYLDAAGRWRGGVVLAGAGLALVLVFVLLLRALAAVDRAMTRPFFARAVLAIAAIGCALLVLPARFGGGAIDAAAAGAAWQQASETWDAFAALHGIDKRATAALHSPEAPLQPLPGLAGQDVYLIYVESYGTIVLDQPSYRKVVAPALADFAKTVAEAGYHLLSNRIVSPTFGGGSWLAHDTFDTGIKLDPLLDQLIVNGHRLGLPRYMAAAGYRTVEVAPGIKKPYPQAKFWGFNANYYSKQLAYKGPPFGWFDIPDQYTLAQFTKGELAPGHKPLFAQIVLVSSHTPFAPVPPYLSEWRDAGSFKTVPQTAWHGIYAQPDWSDLDRPYLQSIDYVFKTLGAWLARTDGNALVIILGDHEPPGLTLNSRSEPWTVPIYVLSRDAALVQPFAAHGYRPGVMPPAKRDPEGMEKFLGEFLAAYGASAPRVATPASAPPQSPAAPAAFRPSPG